MVGAQHRQQDGQPAELGRHALLLPFNSFRVQRNITTCLIMPRRYATWSRARTQRPEFLSHGTVLINFLGGLSTHFLVSGARFAHPNCSSTEWDSLVAGHPPTPHHPYEPLRPADGAAGLLIRLA
jgi:hypothetical protein